MSCSLAINEESSKKNQNPYLDKFMRKKLQVKFIILNKKFNNYTINKRKNNFLKSYITY